MPGIFVVPFPIVLEVWDVVYSERDAPLPAPDPDSTYWLDDGR